VGVDRRRGEVVDGHDFDVTTLLRGPEEDPADAAEPVDAHSYCHPRPPLGTKLPF
jgi:hypothetical protein